MIHMKSWLNLLYHYKDVFGLSCFSGFLKLEPKFFIGGDDFEISFEFKTDQLNSLLLFAYDINGEDFILVSFVCMTKMSDPNSSCQNQKSRMF